MTTEAKLWYWPDRPAFEDRDQGQGLKIHERDITGREIELVGHLIQATVSDDSFESRLVISRLAEGARLATSFRDTPDGFLDVVLDFLLPPQTHPYSNPKGDVERIITTEEARSSLIGEKSKFLLAESGRGEVEVIGIRRLTDPKKDTPWKFFDLKRILGVDLVNRK